MRDETFTLCFDKDIFLSVRATSNVLPTACLKKRKEIMIISGCGHDSSSVFVGGLINHLTDRERTFLN